MPPLRSSSLSVYGHWMEAVKSYGQPLRVQKRKQPASAWRAASQLRVMPITLETSRRSNQSMHDGMHFCRALAKNIRFFKRENDVLLSKATRRFYYVLMAERVGSNFFHNTLK